MASGAGRTTTGSAPADHTGHDGRVRRVAEQRDLDLVVLFGSRASGKVHPGSDVDVAVRSREGKLDLSQQLDIAADLALILGAEVDVVDLRRADPLFLKKIFEHALCLFEREGAFFAERLRAFHRYQDYRPYLQREREAVRRALGL